MKKLILFASTLLTLSTAAEARYFRMGVDCYVDQGHGTCVAYNDSNRPMFCKGRISGRTYYGQSMRGSGSGWVYPGQNFYAYVYSNDPYNNPLVRANGRIDCRF